MGERGEGSVETGNEYIPSQEEVLAHFKDLVNGKAYVETKKEEDEKGLNLWNIEITRENGDKEEYSYKRKKRLHNGTWADTRIYVTLYDTDGIPFDGSSVMACDDQGVWRKTP